MEDPKLSLKMLWNELMKAVPRKKLVSDIFVLQKCSYIQMLVMNLCVCVCVTLTHLGVVLQFHNVFNKLGFGQFVKSMDGDRGEHVWDNPDPHCLLAHSQKWVKGNFTGFSMKFSFLEARDFVSTPWHHKTKKTSLNYRAIFWGKDSEIVLNLIPAAPTFTFLSHKMGIQYLRLRNFLPCYIFAGSKKQTFLVCIMVVL